MDAATEAPSAAPVREDWAQTHDRRVHAARVARRLQPAARLLGGYASSRLRVRLTGKRERRPAVALVEGDPPVDGIATEPPLLVVELGADDVAWWLSAGSRAVWVLQPRRLVVHGAAVVALGPHERVALPAPCATQLRVSELLPARGMLVWPPPS